MFIKVTPDTEQKIVDAIKAVGRALDAIDNEWLETEECGIKDEWVITFYSDLYECFDDALEKVYNATWEK